jgi:3-dehydroquinate synthase
VGVKNGVNVGGSKNFIGTFAPPAAVINDAFFLRTLASRDRVAGIAEAFKVAVIKDHAFLDWLIENAPKAAAGDEASLEHLIRRCAEMHLRHIETGGDPFERGSARPLDFGHWAAHRLETLSLHELRHGEAVAIGMAIDLFYAAELGLLADVDAQRVLDAMELCGLPLWHEALELCDPSGRAMVLGGIADFREHLGGELHITLPDGLGAKCEVNEMDEAVVLRCVDRLRSRARRDVSCADPS